MLFGASTGEDQPGHRTTTPHCGTADQGGRRTQAPRVASGPDNRQRPGMAAWCGGVFGATRLKVPQPLSARRRFVPQCQKGKVTCFSDPAVLVRVVGMAPLSARWYERSACAATCVGEVFTAPPPTGGTRSTTRRQAAMIALKYGAGLPFNRSERLQGPAWAFRCPQATQWEIRRSARPTVSKPVHGDWSTRAPGVRPAQ